MIQWLDRTDVNIAMIIIRQQRCENDKPKPAQVAVDGVAIRASINGVVLMPAVDNVCIYRDSLEERNAWMNEIGFRLTELIFLGFR